ncbi:hypothetical protein QZH44_30305 (plasmid) [Pseudomonas corrugata]|uniref:hypothetical protein n=1 Tax=Pseudomonas corrugata TaxID=47879 RepID=UPI003D81958F
MKKVIVIVGAAAVAFAALVLVGVDLNQQFSDASAEEIKSVTAESICSRGLLLQANREARIIRVRDLERVRTLCARIDQQANAF